MQIIPSVNNVGKNTKNYNIFIYCKFDMIIISLTQLFIFIIFNVQPGIMYTLSL